MLLIFHVGDRFFDRLPEWLASGTLLRVVPADYGPWGPNNDEVRHWFDPWAAIVQLEFGSGSNVKGRSRMLESPPQQAATAPNSTGYVWMGIGTPPHPGPRSDPNPKCALGPMAEPNGDVNAARMGDTFLALTDASYYTAFDGLGDLATTAPSFKWRDRVEGPLGFISAAHPAHDASTGEWFDFVGTFDPLLFANETAAAEADKGLKYDYTVFRVPNATAQAREKLAKVPMRGAAMIHSMGLTDEHLVVLEYPYRMGFLKPRTPKRGGIADFAGWVDGEPVVAHVVHRATGVVASIVGGANESWFNGHTINTFLDPNDKTNRTIVHDVIAYPHFDLLNNFRLDVLAGGAAGGKNRDIYDGRVRRCTIKLGVLGGGSFSCEDLANAALLDKGIGLELPMTNRRRVDRRPYQFLWSCALGNQSDYYDRIVKVDVTTGDATIWAPNPPANDAGGGGPLFVNEPMFAPRPGATDEDDGAILTVVFDAATNSSFVAVLDAATMVERARVEAPGGFIGFHFHGLWCDATGDCSHN